MLQRLLFSLHEKAPFAGAAKGAFVKERGDMWIIALLRGTQPLFSISVTVTVKVRSLFLVAE